MPVLRWLRIFVPLLLVAVLVAGTVLVLTSRSDLQASRGRVDDAWVPLHSALDSRYALLHAANSAVRDVPGPLEQIVKAVSDDYAHWSDIGKHDPGNVAEGVATANELEADGRRLVIAARRAPRLKGNEEVLSKIDAFAARPFPDDAESFNELVSKFEDLRSRPSSSLAAGILGYGEIPNYDTSEAGP